MKGPAEVAAEIDRLVDDLARIDQALDGYFDEQGEHQEGALDLLEKAEDAWLVHKDTRLEGLAEEYKGRQLPGEEKVISLTRSVSAEARRAWNTYLHAKRLVRRLQEREGRVERQLSGRQTQSKLQVSESGAPDRRGLPVHGQRRAA